VELHDFKHTSPVIFRAHTCGLCARGRPLFLFVSARHSHGFENLGRFKPCFNFLNNKDTIRMYIKAAFKLPSASFVCCVLPSILKCFSTKPNL